MQANELSASHIYVNQDREQYFDVGLFGASDNHKYVGCGPGARALGLLCNQGSWANCRITVMSDSFDEYCQVQQSFVNISVEAELMLLDTDGFRWVADSHETGIIAFAQLCRFALFLDRHDVGEFLDKQYGRDKWRRKFDEHCKLNNSTHATDLVVAAHQRGLQI